MERFRPGVQPVRVADIADVTDEDCKAIEWAMANCWKWLPGHDQAAVAPAEMSEPRELCGDIVSFENWVGAIIKVGVEGIGHAKRELSG